PVPQERRPAEVLYDPAHLARRHVRPPVAGVAAVCLILPARHRFPTLFCLREPASPELSGGTAFAGVVATSFQLVAGGHQAGGLWPRHQGFPPSRLRGRTRGSNDRRRLAGFRPALPRCTMGRGGLARGRRLAVPGSPGPVLSGQPMTATPPFRTSPS